MYSEIEKALELWIELTGVDPQSTSFKYGDWDIHEMNKALKEGLELDTTNALALLMLDYFAYCYFDQRSFTVQQSIDDFSSIQEYLNKCHELLEILKKPELEVVRLDFQNHIREAMSFYDVKRKDVDILISDRHSLVFLWRDALKAINIFEVFQFLQGGFDEKTPVYIQDVHEFWNINSLLKYMCVFSENGISLNLIRSQDGVRSYFAFAVRNGANLSILSDKHKYTHPLQHRMTRSPGRHLAERMYKNHFPYDLLNIEIDHKRNARVLDSGTPGLVPYQKEALKLKRIQDLEPQQVIWIFMMFSLITEKFWKNKFKTKQLSYTGEMVKVDRSLIDFAETQPLAVERYRSIKAPALKVEDVLHENVKDQWKRKPTKKNKWLEDRYKDKVPNRLLNLCSTSTEIQWVSRKTLILRHEDETQTGKSRLLRYYGSTDQYKLQALDPTEFGTQKELVRDQKWFARYNFAQLIQREADLEFEKRKDEITNWYRDAVTANLPVLLKAIQQREFKVIGLTHKSFGDTLSKEKQNIMSIYSWEKWNDKRYYSFPYFGFHTVILEGSGKDKYRHCCYFTNQRATIQVIFEPTTYLALEELTGQELPDVLQNWVKQDQYSGNSILDRVDPMEWVVENPWKEINFNVEIYLTKRTLRTIQIGNIEWLLKRRRNTDEPFRVNVKC